ncbi:MAG: hypothetical protein COB61_002725 [Thiotrichales bacterium]|nr:hypothetical protein [Thiotrichales bacterium]
MTLLTIRINSRPQTQHGFVLISALVFLTMLTMLGVTAFDSTNLEEAMTRNARSQATAKQAAESALRDAETFIGTTITHLEGLESPSTPGQLMSTENEPDPLVPTNWTLANSKAATTPVAYINAANQPLYMFSFVGNNRSESSLNSAREGYDRREIGVTPISYFKTTVRGVAADGVTESILQIHFAKRLDDQK